MRTLLFGLSASHAEKQHWTAKANQMTTEFSEATDDKPVALSLPLPAAKSQRQLAMATQSLSLHGIALGHVLAVDNATGRGVCLSLVFLRRR